MWSSHPFKLVMKKILYIFLLTFSVSLFAQSPCVHLSIDTISEPYCPSDFGGQLEVSVLGGSGMYSYLWLDSLGNNPSGIPSSSASVSNLNLHEYWVYVTDLIQNCTDSASASFLTYSCVEDTASLSIVSQFSTNPVDYDTYSSCQLMITNNGCEIDLKPEFIISHDSPIAEGAITVEYYNSITSSWENINYSIVNGNAVGYWGDLDGENVGCGSNQSRPVRVLFSQFNPTASLGLYTASLRLWKVNGNGDLLDIISEETLITIELQDTICNNFEFNLITQDASCGNQSDGLITLNSSGGLAPVQYGLNNLNYDSQNTFTALQADNYIVYGQDANGCQISDTLILGPPILDPDTIWFTNINPADALVNWDFNNLVDGYRFRYRVIGESTWIGPVSSPGAYNDGVSNPTTYKMIGGLMGGSSYELQVKTNSLIDNCEEGWSDSHFFETPTESFVFDVGNTCYQLQTGFITLEFNGEMPGYNFSWTDGISFSSTDTSIFDLVSGNYQLMVTNPLDIVILDTSFVISENIPESIDFFLNGDSSLVNQIGNQSFISVCNAESFVETQSGLTNHVWSNGYNGSSMLLDTIPNNTILNLTATNQDGCTVSSSDLYLTIITDFINFQQANTNGDVINHANYFCSSDSSLFLDISDYTSGNFSINWSRIDNNNLISLGTEDSIVLTPTQSSSYLLEIYNCAYQFNVNYLQSIPTTLDISNVLCFGDSGASVIVNAQSTSNEVLIEVFNSDSEVIYSDTIQNLASGFYDVYVSDTTAMCPFENEFEISEPDSLYIHTEDIGSLLCYGDEYGTFMFSVEGGLPPFSFILNGTPIDLTQNPADGSFLLENLTPINYILEVSDSNNCLDTLQFVIEEPDSLIFGVTDFTQNLDCYGDTTAFIQLNVEGGTPSYSFELFDDSQVLLLSQSYSLFSNLTANEYLVTVTDTNGCVDSLFVTISQNDELIVEENEIQHQDISCFNLNDGQVGLDISGGIFPYSATNLSTTLTSSPYLFDNLIADSLTFIVTDSVGCTAELSTVILGLDSFLLDTIQINPISCGEEFGSIDFLLIGSSTYTFELNGTSVEPVFQNDTLATLDSLVVNQYTFIVFDQFGCSDTIYFEMTNQLSTLDLDTISYSDTIQCFGDTTGFINLVTNGGISPFVYTVFLNNELIITDSTEVSNLSNLVAGEYQIIVQDSIDCSSSINLDIFENEELVISEDLDLHQNISCYGQSDGTFELIVEGGVSPYAVQINQGAIDVLSNPYSNLNASDYNVLITDGLGCADSLLVVITEPDSLFLSMTSVDDITCIDSVSSFNFDINGGSEPYIYTIGEDTVIPVLDPLSGLMQITGLAGGSYNLIVEDNNGCEDSTSFQIIDYRINYNFSVVNYLDTILCFGDSTAFIEVNASGGLEPYVYSVVFEGDTLYTQTQPLFDSLVAGEYQLVSIDSNQCIETIELTIYQNEELVISEDLDLHQNVSCYGQSDGTFELIVEGGVSPYAVQINQGAIDVLSNPYSNLNASDYNVLITDGLGCADSLLVVITEPDSLFLSMTSVDDITCIDSVSSFNFDINGGSEPYIYTIGEDTVIPVLDPLSGLMQITGLAGGSYNLIVEDNNGCEDSTSFQIIDYRINYNFSVVNYLDTILCFGDSTAFIEVNASGGLEPYVYSVVFEGDTLYTQTQPLFDSLVAGEYQLVSIDSNQCIETIELTIYQNEELIVSDSLEIHRDVLCVGGTGSFTLTADGGVPNYQLNILGEASFNYPNTYENLDAGLYEVIITDALGCTNDIEITIDNPDTLFFESFVVQDVLCFGDSNGELNFSASGGVAPYYYFLDSDSSKSLNEFSIGFYTIEVFDVNGCIIDSTFEVSEPQLLTLGINVSQTQNISCFNGDDGEISLTANGGVFPYQYQIDGGTLQNQNSFSNLDPGTFEMTIVDGNGCDTSILYTLTQPSEDFVISSYSLSDTLGYCVLCYGDSSGTIDIEVSGGAYPFNYFANGTQDSTPTDSIFNNLVGSQDYEFYVVDSLGCFSDTLMINCNSTSEIELSATNQVTPLCCYSCDGQATINASGGTQPFVFSHNGSAFQSSNLFDQTCGGFNQFEVIDANGCQFQQTLSLANIECLELDTFNYMNINNPAVSNYDSCKTENTAHIFVKAIAGVSPFKISFDSQEFIDGGQMFYDGLSSGEYDIVLMDNNLCLDTISVNISEANPLILDSLTIDNLFCGYPSVNSITNVSETGGFTSSVSGGTPSLNGYEFSLDQIDSSSYSYNNSFDNLGNGIYSVNVLDELGCSLEFDVEVNGFSSSAQYVINDISCPGLDDGTIELISVSGTVSPWIEFDENLFSGSYLGGITAGEHILSTQFQYPNDNSLICINYDTIFFYEAQAIEYDLDIESINCNGDCSGSIFINSAVGGTPPYTYSCLTNGETGMFYEDLCVGDYVVRVTDSLGCYESTIVSVGENNPIYPLISQNNGNLVVLEPTNDNPSSGTPPYSYQWYNESGVLAGETSETLSLSVKGRYYVIVTDSFGCEGISAEFNVETVDINSFGLLEFNIFPNPFTDYLNLEYSGDDNVLWTISDNLGRLILKGEFNKSDEINVQSLNNGIYFLTLTKDNNESIFKIIKE